MEIDWIHRPDTLNLCFNALDRHVVRGLAEEVALRVDRFTAGRTEHTFARLLEEVAAFGGVLRAFGVGPRERVLSRLPMGLHGLVAALATARVGAVHVLCERYDDPVGPLAAHRPAVVLAQGSDSQLAEALRTSGVGTRAAVWTGDLPDGQELQWDVVLRAGRTDPAPSAEVPLAADAFVVGDRTLTVGQALADDGTAWPLDAIGTLVAGGTLVLALP
jgi:acyl-CoA synthetase (AMP-forming)/AMP-acid ligase II